MKKEELDFILEKGEGYFIEFKESFDKSLSKEVENMGTGINRIKNLCADYNNKEPEFVFNEFFSIVFTRLGLNEGLNEGLKTLYQVINKYPCIQNKQLSITLDNRPIKTIERQISELVKLNKVERRGSKKTGGYYAI